ncbi:hypothetical protein NL676_001591 [Syzygium grande]|nr:hypothetical protein NL676_001591 [Syzygium grande]
MGLCHGKPIEIQQAQSQLAANSLQHDPFSDEASQIHQSGLSGVSENKPVKIPKTPKSSKFPFYSPSPLPSLFKNSPAVGNSSSVNSTPLRIFKRPFPAPFPGEAHQGFSCQEASIPEGGECEIGLDKNFGFSKQFGAQYEMGEEIGRGNFGYACSAKAKKGSLKGLEVAVKVIPKSKMTTAIAIEDVRREVKILRALTGHKNLIQFYDAYEDEDNIYIVMELCQGGELLDRILSRGGKYSEEDAKIIMVQVLSAVAFCHLQGVVHRDLKPENFLFTTKDEHAPLKAIDFGLSDYVKPDERLNDIVGSAYYVSPEVLHRSYGTEADMWSIGVIAYILLCGSRPFWARTESGIFRAVLKADPSFDENPWPSLSPEAIDFVKRLLNKDYRKRPTAAQALCHPWLASHHEVKIPLDMIVYRLVRAYIWSSSLRRSFACSRKDIDSGSAGLPQGTNFKTVVAKNFTDAMKQSRILDYAHMVSSFEYGKFDFEEFCAAAISVHQLEGTASWEEHARKGFELFEKEGNRPIMIDELASELGLSTSVSIHVVLQDWIRPSDGKLSFFGFIRLLHGASSRTIQKF